MHGSHVIARREALGLIGAGAAAWWTGASGRTVVAEPHSPNSVAYTDVTLKVRGATKPFTFVHLSDVHLCDVDHRDGQGVHDYLNRRRVEAFGGAPGKVAKQLFRQVNAWKPDFVAITGDLIDYPSAASIDAATALMDSLDVPHWFAIGNHEWYYGTEFVGIPPEASAGRAYWFPKFNAAWGPQPLDWFVQRFCGVNLLFIDDSVEQLSASQVEQTEKVIAAGRPCLIFMHVPVDVAPFGKIENVMRYQPQPESQGIPCYDQEWTTPTNEFHRLIRENENVRALFVGHLHVNRVDEIDKGRYQYVVGAAFQKHCRRVRVEPV